MKTFGRNFSHSKINFVSTLGKNIPYNGYMLPVSHSW